MSDYESWLEFTEECRQMKNAKCFCGKIATKFTIFGDLCEDCYKIKSRWFCPNCQSIVPLKLINVTGYTDAVCAHCDTVLKANYYGYEKEEWQNETE